MSYSPLLESYTMQHEHATQHNKQTRFSPLLVCHRQHNSLNQLLDLLVETANVGILLGGTLVHLHGLDSCVILRRQGLEDEVRVLVDADQVTRLQLLGIHQADHWQKVSLQTDNAIRVITR